MHDDSIEIIGVGRLARATEVRTDLTDFSRMILETITDEASLRQYDGVPTFKIVKRKSS